MATDFAALVREDRVHTDLYRDPDIFAAEMDRIFKGTWVWVAHASEVPTRNSFKTSHVGLQPVIVTRDREDKVHVHLNRCRHRAASVCEARQGKASVFVCPYHGWSYEVDGRLRKVPFAAGYGEDFRKEDYPLVSLRTEEYGGLIFATFRDDIEPLADFLGPARKWIDLFMKQGAGYGVRTNGEHRFRFPGNWKIQLENTTDAYHFPIVHKTFLTSLDEETENLFDVLGQGGWLEDLGNGHSVMVMIPELVDLEAGLDADIPERFQVLADELTAEGHSDDAVRRIVRAVGGSGFNLNLFPNLACSMAFFRVLRPIAVDETEIRHVAIAMDGGPEAGNRARLRLHEHFQGPMGFGTPDDAEGWERVQRGSAAGDDLWILLNRGLSPDGANIADVSAETGMRAAYGMWEADDGGMSAIGLEEAQAFVWAEAELLDNHDYLPWLALWTATGRYVIPAVRDAPDPAAVLNIAYDDADMRTARVKRLRSGFSMSAAPPARTVRTVSRFVAGPCGEDDFVLRAAQHIVEYKYERTRMLAADVAYRLIRDEAGLKIDEKTVRLINCDDALHGIGYLF